MSESINKNPENNFDWRGFSFVLEIALTLSFFAATTYLVFGVGTGFFIDWKYSPVVRDQIHAIEAGVGELVSTDTAGADSENADQATEDGDDDSLRVASAHETRTIEKLSITAAAKEHERVIGVDLEAMELYLYEDGNLTRTLPVLSKGTPGSRFETPSGQYTVQYKNPTHFSSIGSVYMPYSMQFYGNFFIHGWPYYPDGEPVPEGYSGGCIRLSTESAKIVYEFAPRGTPIIVTGGIGNDNTPNLSLRNVQLPSVSAESYLVADLKTGQVLLEKNSRVRWPIASITKLMTAVVANETIAYNDPIRISQNAINTYGEAGGLILGEELLLETLYYPLLLESSNDAAHAIAYHRGMGHFLDLMNSKARSLGMTQTHFADPSGLSPQNTSTAVDLFRLAHYIHTRKSFIFDTTKILQKNIPLSNTISLRSFTNNNPLRNQPNFAGGKNGYIPEAKHTLLSLFDVQVQDEEHTILVLVLRSEDNDGDTLKLLSWLQQAAEGPNSLANY